MSMSNLKSVIAENIRFLREKKGWTQKQLADQIDGVYQPHISHLELGTYNPSVETIDKLSKIFGVTPDILLKTPIS